ncbi:autophagy protein Apg5-domain-containing protein [Phakopsora pachyrhizi]|uniref:Autophagy protein 5 n=1 Tax=Phakopsora pachyrhizi TaxID=170000 RepID=A0AAV0BJY0_PHAPC|nr:autophagy protein Apg5-domain-containing protein [Phakopsora pachyrhizi]CAH7686630.1 autophagy protein Apg5-domain-containing protein [Phakopsora pachyrhizi]
MDPGDLDSISKSSPTALRSLIWEGSIPICFILETGELPNGSDRSVEAFYTSVPRLSYLSLLVPLVLSNLIKLCLDEASLISLKSENIWFEHGASKTPLRWHWPVGLIYDVLVASLPSSSTSLPLQVIVHLHPPPAEKILLPNTIAACRDAFMNQVKEADFVRSGSTKRVTNLRQREAESLWEGLVEHDFDKFWLVASKLIPTPPAIRNSSSAPITLNQSSTTGDKMPDGNGIRRVPLRVYLPDQAPVLQSNSGPVDPDGRPATLGLVLKGLIPLLFPEPITNSKRRLARAFIQGTQVPLETELGWLGTVMCCADGWVPVVIHLGR